MLLFTWHSAFIIGYRLVARRFQEYAMSNKSCIQRSESLVYTYLVASSWLKILRQERGKREATYY